MNPFEPDFEVIKMDAEIGSYQEDFEPDRDGPDVEEKARTQATTDDTVT
jgi:hypothetical protein